MKKIRTKIKNVRIEHNYQLEVCLCSCMDEHYPTCPNFGKILEESNPVIKMDVKIGKEVYEFEAELINRKFKKIS